MKTYNGYARKELIKLLALEKVNFIKKEMENNGKRWDYGNGFQTKNTLVRTWEHLYSTYPLFSKTTPMFSLSYLYDELIKSKK